MHCLIKYQDLISLRATVVQHSFLWWHISKITSFWCQTPKEQKRGNILVIAPLTQLFLLFGKRLKIFPQLICFSRLRRDVIYVNVVLVEFELHRIHTLFFFFFQNKWNMMTLFLRFVTVYLEMVSYVFCAY